MKQLSKKWKIFIITIVVLIGSFYGYYKINNRNAFEEMYNSYYNFIPATALYNMPQIEPMPRDEIGLDIAELYYKDTKNDMKIEFSLISFNNEKSNTNRLSFVIILTKIIAYKKCLKIYFQTLFQAVDK